MAVEKMALMSVSGPLKKVNKTLAKCCETKCFHIEPNYYTMTYGSAEFKTLKDKDIYGKLIKRADVLKNGLGIPDNKVDYEDITLESLHDFDEYFSQLEKSALPLINQQAELKSKIEEYEQVLKQVVNMSSLDADFRDLFSCKHVKVRFGKMPSESYTKLKFYGEKSFVFVPFEEKDGFVWGVYFAPLNDGVQTDDIFTGLYFERIRIPDFVSGDGETAVNELRLQKSLFEKQLAETNIGLVALKQHCSEQFTKVRSKLIFLNESYELRGQVSVINNRFHMAGFVPKREVDAFKAKLSEVPDIVIEEKKYFLDDRMKPPTKLRNIKLFKPFEMFVKMYGLPSYNGIDPTAYVAITFMLIYGIMFGDLGQGLVISLLGIILTKWKNVKLGPIMTRIGISSAFFGFLYGSVFGNEELIKPFFHIEPLYTAMGKPHNIFGISSYLLICALVIGVILITISMIMNIVISIKRKDYESAFFGNNGINGLIFYLAVAIGAALQLGFGIPMFSPVYIVVFVVIPLVIMLFKEPLAHLIAQNTKRNVLQINHSHIANNVAKHSTQLDVNDSEFINKNLDKVSEMEHIRAVYGRMPADSFEKLGYFDKKEFVYIPLSSDKDNVYGIYFVPKKYKVMADDIFNDLGFERMRMPAELSAVRPTKESKKKNTSKEKKSVGNFIIEGFIELFETFLSYLTNTMSFLRVGGFILSHAGMMLVVNVLAGDTLNVGSVIVLILGNAFVIGLEGFIVGIQVLRLEFYEIFGRFYKGDGKEFVPMQVKN